MALSPSPSIVTSSLVLYFDQGNTQKSWRGFPTTNLNSLTGIGIYNNVPGHVTATLATTGEVYLGAPVYKLTLTPTTATGVSYLTAGNNPGIGVVTGGGGGLANRYTGHSIFFRTTVPMHTNPIYTHYSNIPGWQSSTGYDRTSDGWYRAYVTWYYSATQSDGKYWAINPATATLNNPIVIYWAAPFKEDSNVNTFVSPYVESVRSSTQAMIDMTGNNTLTPVSMVYTTSGSFDLYGAGRAISISGPAGSANGDVTLIAAVNQLSRPGPHQTAICTHTNYRAGIKLMSAYHDSGCAVWVANSSGNGDFMVTGPDIQNAGWKIIAATRSMGGPVKMYVNGVLVSSSTGGPAGYMYMPDSSGAKIGQEYHSSGYGYNGTISNTMMYNRVLTDYEIKQNFSALRGRYGI